MKELSLIKRVQVRFSELDPLKVVWHGNYVKYLEDAREEFGRRYGIGYSELVRNHYYAPVYDMHLRFDAPAHMNDCLLVKITYKPQIGAKMVFDYEVTRESDGAVILTASTIQLFETMSGEFTPVEPDFYRVWQHRILYDFYTIESCDGDAYKCDFSINLHPDSTIFRGHFPNQPVAPGACLMQMVKECYEYVSGTLTDISTVKLCRFLKPVEPSNATGLRLHFDTESETDGRLAIRAEISVNDEVCVTLKAELSVRENG